jgi:hypothetical protein
MDPVVCSVPYYTMHQILNFFQEFFQRIRAICRFFNSLRVVRWREIDRIVIPVGRQRGSGSLAYNLQSVKQNITPMK